MYDLYQYLMGYLWGANLASHPMRYAGAVKAGEHYNNHVGPFLYRVFRR